MPLREFRNIVKAATLEQHHNLGELTGSSFSSDPDTLCNHIRYLRAGSIGQLFWDESWKQVVTDVADHVGTGWLALLNGRCLKQLETYEIENAVVAKVFQEMRRFKSEVHQPVSEPLPACATIASADP